MKCPEDMLITTFLYLERLDKLDGVDKKININSNDAKIVCDKIIKVHKAHYRDVEKSLKQKKDLPHDFPLFTMSSKSNLLSVNYVEKNPMFENAIYEKENKILIKTKHDVEISIEAEDIPSGDNNAIRELRDFEANKIYLPNEDSTAYSLVNKNNTICNIQDFIHQLTPYGYDSVFIAEQFFNHFAKYTKTDILSNKDILAEILEFNFSPDIVDAFVKKINEERVDTEYDFEAEKFLESIREHLNMLSKKGLIDIIASRTEGLKKFNLTLSSLLDNKANEEFLKKASASDTCNVMLSLESIAILNPIYNISSRANDRVVYAKIGANKKEYKDDMVTEKKVSVVPTKTFFDLSSTSIQMELDYSENSDGVLPIRKSSEQASKDYFYHSNIIENKENFVLSVDESDAGAKGNKADVMRSLAEKSDNIVLATGTFLDGYPKNIAYQMAYLDGIKDVKEFSQQLTESYGIFSLRNTAIKNLINATLTQKHYSDMFYSTAISFHKSKEDSYKIAVDFTNDFIKSITDDGIVMGEIEFSQALQTFTYCFTQAKNILEYGSGADFLKSLVFSNRNGRNTLIKEEAGLQSVFSFIQLLNSQEGGHINIATRELLHGVNETIDFPDRAQHFNTKNAIINNEISAKDISDNNIQSALIFEAYCDYYARENFVPTIKYIMQSNFEYFVDSLIGKDSYSKFNYELLQEENDFLSEITREEFISQISETNKTTKNSITEQYKRYLNSNGNMDNVDEEKRELLNIVIDKFQKHFLDAYMYDKETEFVMANSIFPEKMSSNSGEMILKTDLYFKSGYPFLEKEERPIEFSKKVGFYKEAWKEFLPHPIEYDYKMGSHNNVEVMNVFASKGRDKQIKSDIDNGYSPVIGSARTLSTAFNVCDAIANAICRANKEKVIQIQVVQSSDLKKILNKIDTQKLFEKHNIELLIAPSNLISNEVNKANARQIQSPIFTNIDAGARGLDLSPKGMFCIDDNGRGMKKGKLYTTGTTVSPANLQQFFSRTFKPRFSESAEISVFSGGKNIALKTVPTQENSSVKSSMNDIEKLISAQINEEDIFILSDNNKALEDISNECIANGIVEQKMTFNDSNAEGALEALAISKEFMSGERSDKSFTNLNEIVEISEAYANLINSREPEIEMQENVAI